MRIFVMSKNGDDLLGEWSDASAAAAVARLEKRCAGLKAKGYRAFGMSTGARLDELGPGAEEDVLFIAPMVGG